MGTIPLGGTFRDIGASVGRRSLLTFLTSNFERFGYSSTKPVTQAIACRVVRCMSVSLSLVHNPVCAFQSDSGIKSMDVPLIVKG